jgi:hypothetical protein
MGLVSGQREGRLEGKGGIIIPDGIVTLAKNRRFSRGSAVSSGSLNRGFSLDPIIGRSKRSNTRLQARTKSS